MKGGAGRAVHHKRRRRACGRNCRGPPIRGTTKPPEEGAGPPEDRIFKAGSFGGAFDLFAGFIVGARAVILDPNQLSVFLAYVGTPAATAIGFYSWKAKAENVVKIKQANPTATEGIPVDLNNIQP